MRDVYLVYVAYILIFLFSVAGANYEFSFNQSNINLNTSIPIIYTINGSLDVRYYAFITGQNNIFFNDSPSYMLNITITIPNSTMPGNYSDIINLSNAADNYTEIVTFQFNILNQSNQTSIPNLSVSILNVNPPNGKIFTTAETKPSFVVVNYNGSLNYSRSNITLTYNGQQQSWIILKTTIPGQFSFQLDQKPDGIYRGKWNLTSTDNQSTYYEYEFSILTQIPPKVFAILPSKGRYTNEMVTLEAQTNGTNYTVQWIINDGYPLATSGKWKSLSQTGNRYSETINFLDADVGAVYLKIIDAAGNYRIQPTGIISAPSFRIDPESDRITAYKDKDVTLDFTVKRKAPDMTSLRCKLENLVKDKGTSMQYILNINGQAELTRNTDKISLKNDYDQTLNIGNEKEATVTMELIVPKDTPSGDYVGDIQCVMAK